MNCLNCGSSNIQDAFCPACGQKTITKRLSAQQILIDIGQSLTNTEAGVLHTLKELSLHPGSFIRQYIDGARVSKYNPFQYVLITTAFYLLLDHTIGYNIPVTHNEEIEASYYFQIGAMIGQFSKVWVKWLILLMPLIYALCNLLFYRKYNFAEHLIVGCYAVGHGAVVAAFFVWMIPGGIPVDVVFQIVAALVMIAAYTGYRPRLERVIIAIINSIASTVIYFLFVVVIFNLVEAILA